MPSALLLSLIPSIAEAVLSYVIVQLDPVETVKTWLKRDPASLALQKALTRAYAAFSRQYPEYAASLFDETFLVNEGSRELSKLLIRNQHPDPALLAQAWGKSIGAKPEFANRATKPMSDFLMWLEAEIKAEQVFQALFDSRALDSLPRLEAEIDKLTKELTRGLDAALKIASEYERIAIKVEGDIKDSNVILGNDSQINVSNIYNTYYTGAFDKLNDFYIQPDSVFQRVRVDEFVGRDWLTAKVDAFLNEANRKSGAFLLIGDAGVGKTSFMAHLVKERRYLHLFAEQVAGDANLQRALQSLGSQLVTRYQIDPYKDRDTLTQLAVFPDFLERLLRLAASTLTNGEKIVIVCDALDEAGTFPDGNVFGLPNVLPDGVYFILSQRPVNTKLPNFEPLRFNLEAQGVDNLQDMQTYLSAVAKRPEVAGQIRSKEYSESFFTQILKEKSLGVWMYLHYIIKEIESGSRAPLDLENLPTGLTGYYADYWDDWRYGRRGRGKGEDVWNTLYSPLLTTLAAAQEAITVEQLIQWSGVKASPREVAHLLNQSWRSFITEKELVKSKVYAPYHLSFRDFITGKVNFDKLDPKRESLVRDLAEQTVEAHARIVKAFEEECNGEWEKLVDQEYQRLYLSVHLAGAGEYEKLRILLTEGDEKNKWAEAKEKKEETYAGYLNDLNYIWEHAKREQKDALAVRCMLIENSIHSLAANIPPEVLAELAKTGLWSYARLLLIVRQKSNDFDRAKSLELIAPYLPPLLIQEAVNIADQIQWGRPRALSLAALVPYIDNKQKPQVLIDILEHLEGVKPVHNVMSDPISFSSERREIFSSIAPYIKEDLMPRTFASASMKISVGERAESLSALAPYLNGELMEQAFSMARTVEDDYIRSSTLCSLLPYLDEGQKKIALQEAASATIKIKSDSKSILAFFGLAPYVDEAFETIQMQDVLAAAYEIENKSDRVTVLSTIIPHLADEPKTKVLQAALSTTFEIGEESSCIKALAVLAPYLDDELIVQALSDINKIKSEHCRARALGIISRYLNVEQQKNVLQDALSLANKVPDLSNRAITLANILPYLDDLKLVALQDAFFAASSVKEEYLRANALSTLAPYLTEELQGNAVSLAYDIQDSYYRASVLGDLVPFLKNEIKINTIQDALSATHEINNDYSRARALTAVAPHLNGEQLLDAVSIARKIQFYQARTDALVGLASYLDGELKKQILQELLADGRESEPLLAGCLVKIAPLLDDEMLIDTLDEAKGIMYAKSRVEALTAFLPRLNEELKKSVLQDTFSSAQKITFEHDRANAWTALISYLDEDLKSMAIEDTLSIAKKIDDNFLRANILIDLIPHLSKELQVTLLRELLFITEIGSFINLGKIIDMWASIGFERLKSNTIPFIKFQSKQNRNDGLDIVKALTPALTHFHGPEIANELYRTIMDVTRWWP